MKNLAKQMQLVLTARSAQQRLAALIVLLSALLAAVAYPDGDRPQQAQGQPSRGQLIEGEVVGVADGDTITLLDADRRQYRIRLAFIDAPEKAQPHGQAAKQNLSDMVFHKQVRAEIQDIDRYGRAVGLLWLGDGEVNYSQVLDGFAWHYVQYARKGQGSEAFSAYQAAEAEARSTQRGLWAQAGPTPPWQWRHTRRPSPARPATEQLEP